MKFLSPYFAGKNIMFSLSESDTIVMSRQPTDMRKGVDGMCGQIRAVGLDPTDGCVFIFVGRSRQVMKLLHWERGGYAMYYKRLERGRFHPGIFDGCAAPGFRAMRWDELVLLMEGVPLSTVRGRRYNR